MKNSNIFKDQLTKQFENCQDECHNNDIWNAAIEAAAEVVDTCNREGPYQVIAAASRIRKLKK